MIKKYFKLGRLKDFCTGNELMKAWNVSGQDIVDFMLKGWLDAFKFIENSNVASLKYKLPNKYNTLSHLQDEVSKSIVIDRSSTEAVIINGDINHDIVFQKAKKLSVDVRIQPTSKLSSSYRLPTEQECEDLASFLYQAQPDSWFSPIFSGNETPPWSRKISLSIMSHSMPTKDIVKDLYFNISDVNDFAEEHCLPLIKQSDGQQVYINKPPNREVQTAKQSNISATNYFHREGNGWNIGFEGKRAIFPNYKYIRYIAFLLERPCMHLSALDLQIAVDADFNTQGQISKKQALDEGLSLSHSMKDHEVSLNQLRETEKLINKYDDESDPLIKFDLKRELDQKTKTLCKMNSLVDEDGNPSKPPKNHKIDDPQKKMAQKIIKKALANACEAFKKGGLKKLAKHIEENIKPSGNYDFCYRDFHTRWDIIN